ncbi:MAG: TIM barrel protein [Phycisphaerales bacterium]|nr:TIM barrel protein [Phycisphaerales bacterium]
MKRRDFLATSVAIATAGTQASAFESAAPSSRPDPEEATTRPMPLKGNINHSVCAWCYGGMPLEKLCAAAAAMGIKSVELLGEEQWATAKAHGLTCAVAGQVKANPIGRGFNRAENHNSIIADLEARLPRVKEAGLPCQIVFSGNRKGLSDEQGLATCAAGLKRITPLAEKLGVTLVMELLNSRVDHKDYQCDRTPWGVELVRRVGSPRFKLLYDVYHMQIMEGDVIRTIRDNFDHIAHYHTGGNPGRNEIDATQELNYSAICAALVEKKFTGFVAQEFIPTRDPLTSLREAVAICDV